VNRRTESSSGLRDAAALAEDVAPLRLSEIRRRYVEAERALPSAIESALRADARPSAQALLRAIERRRREHRAEGQRLRHLLRFEQELWARGVQIVAGVDEVGMSPLAGPVAAGAVVLKVGWRAPGINDSKQLTAQARTQLSEVIRKEALAYAVAFVEPDEIDRINIYWAGLLAMQRAVQALGVEPQHLLIDARKLRELPVAQSRIVKGDERSLSIAAASIVAKCERDALMVEYDRRYPGYGFAQHKGYPVREHVAALSRLGACPIHRRSFAPVRRALGLPDPEPEAKPESRKRRAR
jgi:ribonuclease HII